MPRVDDKTDAYYRRLLILKFNRQFTDKEANKRLKFELLEELDGIFLWCLEGLKNLQDRGYFDVGDKMTQEIASYRRENNNVLVFVEEECNLAGTIAKSLLYNRYVEWVKQNGYRPLGKNKFGMELLKQFKSITEDKITDGLRVWIGIE